MTNEGIKFIESYKNGYCTLETLQIVYNKGHINREEFIEATKNDFNTEGVEPQEKPVAEPTQEEILSKEVMSLRIQDIQNKTTIKNLASEVMNTKIEIMNMKGGNA